MSRTEGHSTPDQGTLAGAMWAPRGRKIYVSRLRVSNFAGARSALAAAEAALRPALAFVDVDDSQFDLWGGPVYRDGGIALWAAISGRGAEFAPRWWLAIVGIVGLLAGLVAFASPGLTALVLLMFIAGWAIVIGALEIWGAIQLRKEIEGEWWLILSGLLSIAFGVLLIARPGSGALALVWVIASFAILHGCTLIALAFRLKQLRPE